MESSFKAVRRRESNRVPCWIALILIVFGAVVFLASFAGSAFIVGIHFFGLPDAISDGRGFIWIGGNVCVLAMAIMLGLAHSIISSTQSMALTGFGCASILWVSALFTLLSGQ